MGTSSPCGGTGQPTCTSGYKGVPDNFFNASNGTLIKQALQNILANITQTTAASSAVATVAQQGTEGDLILRGAFEARAPSTDTTDAGRLVWFGHLESYWPNSSGQYDFVTNPTKTLCEQMPSPANCWDTAMQPPLYPANYTTRLVYTSKVGSDGVTRLIQFSPSNVVASPGNTQLGPADLLGASSTDVTTAQNLVNWVLGEEQSRYRSRMEGGSGGTGPWILGDIVYSTPVIVGPPSLAAVPSQTKAIIQGKEVGVVQCNPCAESVGFNQYFLNWRQLDPNNTSSTSGSCNPAPPAHNSTDPEIRYRDKMVYVGANDGMIHAFLVSVYDSENGTWAIKPSDVVTSPNPPQKATNSSDAARMRTNRARTVGLHSEQSFGSTPVFGRIELRFHYRFGL